MSEYSLLQDSLQEVLTILRARSERLDRFEAALAALGHRVNESNTYRDDLCDEHQSTKTLGCVHCVQLRLSEVADRAEFLREGLKQVQALAAHAPEGRKAHWVVNIADYVDAVLNPPKVEAKCFACNSLVSKIVLATEADFGISNGGKQPDTAAIELVVVPPGETEPKPVLMCMHCRMRVIAAQAEKS